MADKLIIVESPAKANTIKKFIGGSTKVVASMGHIRDLPKSKLGVDLKTLEPEYINIRGKGDLIKSLKKDAKSAKKVFLATDPDREGEAISWHLAEILGLDLESANRVTFNEITKTGVKNGMANPRKDDIDLVIPHQANIRIIQSATKALGIPQEKVFVNIGEHANTSSACIPTCLDDLSKEGRIKEGMKICMVGFGAGLTSGAIIFEQ